MKEEPDQRPQKQEWGCFAVDCFDVTRYHEVDSAYSHLDWSPRSAPKSPTTRHHHVPIYGLRSNISFTIRFVLKMHTTKLTHVLIPSYITNAAIWPAFDFRRCTWVTDPSNKKSYLVESHMCSTTVNKGGLTFLFQKLNTNFWRWLDHQTY